MPSPTPIDRTGGALDRAILAHRANPTPITRAALMAAGRAHTDAFMREQTATYQERTR